MPTLYMLVGVPGSGKSTWITKQPWASQCAIVSTDNHVEAFAAAQGKTYSEVFDEAMPYALDCMIKQVREARAAGQDIIWDQTSTTWATRRRKISMLPSYKAIAIVFPTPDQDELARRLAAVPGKNIPTSVMKRMISGFQMPSLDEGFTEIREVHK